MTDEENRKLAQLVTYLLESEDWKYIWLNEYSEPIRLFMFKTGLTYRKTKKYIDKALTKLLGPVYNNVQSKLRRKIEEPSDLLFKPKPKQISELVSLVKIEKNTYEHNAGKTLEPRSEFGKKYLEHYGYGSAKNRKQYYRERKFFIAKGYAPWEVEK